MKFAKELEDDLVPEWRFMYFDYKEGKKKIKAVSRALRDANRTPNFAANSVRLSAQRDHSADRLPFTHFDFNQQNRPPSAATVQSDPDPIDSHDEEDDEEQDPGAELAGRRQSTTMFANSPPVLIAGSNGQGSGSESDTASSERIPLESAAAAHQRRYGSFVGTPPDEHSLLRPLELPDPAMSPGATRRNTRTNMGELPPSNDGIAPIWTANVFNPYRAGPKGQQQHFAQRFIPHGHHTFQRSKLQNMFKPHELQSHYVDGAQLEAYEKLDARQNEFFIFLDQELLKIEDFYKMKEDEANDRLNVLRQQLHELRDRRLNELRQARHGGQVEVHDGLLRGDMTDLAGALVSNKKNDRANGQGLSLLKQIEGMVNKRNGSKFGRVTQSLRYHTSPPGPQGQFQDRGDYVRKKDNAPSYRVAKRRLKLALQEYYRGLELLKSYTSLNRTALRKLNKKYDKAVNARPTLRYYSEKVERAYFVKSDVITDHIVALEDLYARYFEEGNHKVAARKLRSKRKSGDQSFVTFRNGLYLAAGTCLAITGLVKAVHAQLSHEPYVPYLLQLYGGYFLIVLQFLLFVLDCKIWTASRINYQLIFEYDTRHTLDWRELAELPCFFLFLNGLFLYLNFQMASGDRFFRYWFIILIVLTLLVMALPFQILYYHARRWWGYSNWRLLFAGLYPVEFRDFYLGDMYCSATYSMSQIEIFFCVYVNNWSGTNKCQSGHSRLLGFFSALPAVWRALHCLRRYKDSRNAFPHLANFCKYMGNILYYMNLSFYRIDHHPNYKMPFIVFAAINGIYCSIWDIFMDWSLGGWWSTNPSLRPRLGFKGKRKYYAAALVDVILRQQWVIYVIIKKSVQQNTLITFFISLVEVLRRAMWSLFRIENEHCNNVDNYRAQRDISLPYRLSEESDSDRPGQEPQQPPASTTGTDLERGDSATIASTMRQRRQSAPTPTVRALQRLSMVVAAAHAQDFEKKRQPVRGSLEDEDLDLGANSSDDDDDDDDYDDDTATARRR